MTKDETGLESEVLDPRAPGPRPGARTLRGPSWIGRNRARIEQGRDMAHMVMPVMPPQFRIGLVAATLAAEGLLTFEDARTGRRHHGDAGVRGIGLALDAATVAATTRFAPAPLVRNARRIAAVRAVFSRMEKQRRMGSA
jgi:hypothetical protein